MHDAPNFDDANLALRIYELRREPELRKARNLVGNVLDGAPWETVEKIRTWGHKENAHFRQVTSYWEIVASFVNRGIFHPDVYLDTCSEGVYTWCVLEPHVKRIREAGSPRFMLQTERVVNENPAIKERADAVRAAMAASREAEAAAAAAKAAKRKRKPAR